MADLVIQFLVTAAMMVILAVGMYYHGYRRGYSQRIQDLHKNVMQAYDKAKADADILNAVAPPRQKTVRIKGTSRRDLNS